MAYRAVVFDFDGVLAKSMQQHAEAYRRLLAPHGIDVTDEQIYDREGARSESIIEEFLDRAGKNPERETIRRMGDEKQAIFQGLGTPELYPEARRLFDTVRNSVPLVALVTGTRKGNLEKIIPDLLPRLDAVLAQDAYSHDKPHPEPYQKAAETLGVAPAECVAVENAVRGVQSAKAAGYGHVVGITTTMPTEALDAAGADIVVADHEAAGTEIARLFDQAR